MPVMPLTGTDQSYLLLAFDESGRERTDDPDGSMTRRAVDTVGSTPITDVFVFSHGWMGDVPAAKDQYNRWFGALIGYADRAKMAAVRPGFRPLLIGLHWPSLPWGDSSLGAAGPSAAFGVNAGGGDSGSGEVSLVDEAVARTCDSPAARAALQTIFDAASRDIAPVTLPPEVRAAYETLNHELGLGAGGPGAGPADDREPFDPERAYATAKTGSVSFGSSFGDGLLAPLRTLSFWTMKDRGRKVGEGNGHNLLAGMQGAAAKAGRDVKFHLMGHSFGCIVVSSMVAGPSASAPVTPVDSLCMVQGALSLWSYCEAIPFGRGGPGYFRRVLDGRVRGPIVTTRSEFDRAVGEWYPWAAGAARQVDFAPGDLPKYGGVGAFGIRGPGIDLEDADLADADFAYGFEPGRVYNLEGSRFIRNGGGFAGAHGDIDNPQVAHAIWQAAGAV